VYSQVMTKFRNFKMPRVGVQKVWRRSDRIAAGGDVCALKSSRRCPAEGLDITPRDGAEAARRSYADTVRYGIHDFARTRSLDSWWAPT
jgi:hypothetical protein